MLEDRDLLHFSDLYSIEVLQQREFVRVKANRPVLVYVGRDRMPIQSYAVDLSGGGLLASGSRCCFEIGEDVQGSSQLHARLRAAPRSREWGRSCAATVQGRRAISFQRLERRRTAERVVRFIFNIQRAERRREVDTRERHGR